MRKIKEDARPVAHPVSILFFTVSRTPILLGQHFPDSFIANCARAIVPQSSDSEVPPEVRTETRQFLSLPFELHLPVPVTLRTKAML